MNRREFVARGAGLAGLMLMTGNGVAQEGVRKMSTVKITLSSVTVDDQDKALAFYTDVVGFQGKLDIPMGPARWLTVVSPQDPDGIELVLEPNLFPPSKTYQAALKEAGIPATAFEVDDIAAEHERMTGLGVVFTMEPTKADEVTLAIFDDTCGNLIQLYQV